MPDAAFVAALLAGLTGSAHCIAMCGGYVAATNVGGVAPLLPARRLALERGIMQAGRLGTYLALGALAGGAGGTAFALSWTAWQQVLYAAANVALLLAAFAIAGAALPAVALERTGLRVFRRALPLASPWIARPGLRGRFVAGMLWGLTPCALIYGMLPLALLSGSALAGASVLLGLWLGTLPALVLAGGLLRRLGERLQARAVRIGAAVLVAAFAIAGLHRALALPGSGIGPFCLGG